MGCAATLVNASGDLRAVLDRVLASGVPNVVEVQVA
jgi:hypothetical protein